MVNKESRSEAARCHSEDMDRLFDKEIKRSISRTKIYGVDFYRKEENGQSAKFILDVDTFIAGAFGCGVFAQKPETVAQYFMELFGNTRVKKVIFAIPPDKNYAAFEKAYNIRN